MKFNIVVPKERNSQLHSCESPTARTADTCDLERRIGFNVHLEETKGKELLLLSGQPTGK